MWWWALKLQKLFCILLKWASLWWMFCGAQTKTACSEKRKVQPPSPEEGGKKKSIPGGTSSGFAFRSWELTNLTVNFALCPSRNNVGVIFCFLRKHCLNMLTVCRCICFSFPRFPGNAQMLATLSGQLLHYGSEMWTLST